MGLWNCRNGRSGTPVGDSAFAGSWPTALSEGVVAQLQCCSAAGAPKD